MKNKALILSTGFAMFSMFFGSGNLVFPVLVGKESGGHFLFAALGILLTGVIVPFLSAITMLLYRGKAEDFFAVVGGKIASFVIPLLALSLMGPFGVLARCITVAHGSFQNLFPSFELYSFSLAFCCLIFLVNFRKSRVVALLGTFLTPILLLALFLISVYGLKNAHFPDVVSSQAYPAFITGLLQGYQTMDLLAALFFSSFILAHIKDHVCETTSPMELFKLTLSSSIVGMIILASVYFVLVMLGTTYSQDLSNIPGEQMLGVIAHLSLGKAASSVVCTAIMVACFTTAVVLTSLFAEFIQKNIFQDKLSIHICTLITLTIGFLVSTLEFSGIASFIGPILETIYPGLIVLTLLNLSHKLFGTKVYRWPIVLALGFKIFSF